DTDDDGLYDDDEEEIYQTDPAKFDTDGDGVGDGEEVFLETDPTVANGGDNSNGDLGNGGSGGVTFDPETGAADEELTGSQIFLRSWQCEGIEERPEILNFDSADGLAELTDACTLSEDIFPFFLGEVNVVGDGNDVSIGEGVHPPLQVGDSPQYRGWNGLTAGGYTIWETVPEGYDQPLVLCDGVFRSAELGANIFELTSINGVVNYDLAEGELMLCDWFNRRQGEDGDGGGEGNANVEPDDRDRDGVSDIEETELYGTEPDDDDTDDDRVVDGDEIRFGLDPLSADTDRDGYTDGEELYDTRTDPLVSDPGGDLLDPVGDEDGDSLLNGEEVAVHGTDPRNVDSDGDRLDDALEVTVYGTNPTIDDTDGDGFSDAEEVDAGTDPLDQNQ
ncbi:MAG: thrombospondin type 3 repeat-containing protein, partial [Chloroflexota bacterium]|nr:thrombospondin type 3 repeat-containing protein [Chloroflexota bacterium]